MSWVFAADSVLKTSRPGVADFYLSPPRSQESCGGFRPVGSVGLCPEVQEEGDWATSALLPLPSCRLLSGLSKFSGPPCPGRLDPARIFIVLVQDWAASGSRCFLIGRKEAIYTGSWMKISQRGGCSHS